MASTKATGFESVAISRFHLHIGNWYLWWHDEDFNKNIIIKPQHTFVPYPSHPLWWRWTHVTGPHGLVSGHPIASQSNHVTTISTRTMLRKHVAIGVDHGAASQYPSQTSWDKKAAHCPAMPWRWPLVGPFVFKNQPPQNVITCFTCTRMQVHMNTCISFILHEYMHIFHTAWIHAYLSYYCHIHVFLSMDTLWEVITSKQGTCFWCATGPRATIRHLYTAQRST